MTKSPPYLELEKEGNQTILRLVDEEGRTRGFITAMANAGVDDPDMNELLQRCMAPPGTSARWVLQYVPHAKKKVLSEKELDAVEAAHSKVFVRGMATKECFYRLLSDEKCPDAKGRTFCPSCAARTIIKRDQP